MDKSTSDIKHVLVSKTLWTNLVAILAFYVQSKYGFVIDESFQVELLGILNIILRSVTHEPVTWSIKKKASNEKV